MESSKAENEEVSPNSDIYTSDIYRFELCCLRLRQAHVFAFIIGLFCLGIPYAMAGISGANPLSEYPPLITYWSKRRIKWFAIFALLGELYFLWLFFLAALHQSVWIVLILPVVLSMTFAIIEVLYEVFKKTDGFLVTRGYSLGYRGDLEYCQGPSQVVSGLLSKLNVRFAAVLGLIWAWLLGLVFVTTFFVGVGLAVMFSFFIIAITIALLVIGTIFSDGSSHDGVSISDTLDVVPPIPIDGHHLFDASGRLVLTRKKDRIYSGRHIVGFVAHDKMYCYWRISRDSQAVFSFDGNTIYNLLENEVYGKIEGMNIVNLQGNVLYRLEKVQA